MPGAPYRAARIAEVLSSRSDWSVEELGRLQMDAVSLQAQRFMSVLGPLLADDERFVGILQWDGSYEDSRYASWFEAFYRAGAAEVLAWACGPEAARYVLAETDLIPFFFWLIDDVLLDPTGGWAGEQGRDAALRRLAIAALATAANRAAVPTMTMRHIMLGGRLPRWIGFDRGPVPLRGGRATIHQTQQLRAGGRDITAGPSFRLVTDSPATMSGPPIRAGHRIGASRRGSAAAYVTGSQAGLSPCGRIRTTTADAAQGPGVPAVSTSPTSSEADRGAIAWTRTTRSALT
jgi:penicillin amidase